MLAAVQLKQSMSAHLEHRVRPKIIIALHLFLITLSKLALPGHEQLLHVLFHIVHLLVTP